MSTVFAELRARGLSLPPASQKGEIFNDYIHFFFLTCHTILLRELTNIVLIIFLE